MNLSERMTDISKKVDVILDEKLPAISAAEPLAELARYATLDSGKKVRSFLVAESAKLFDVDEARALRAAAAIETIHSFSLIHDDLPAMDNDELRRGKASVWKKYGDGYAILAGDIMEMWAITGLLRDEKIAADLETRANLAGILADACCGMCNGQFFDLRAEDGEYKDATGIDMIQRLKTGAIFGACVEMAAALAHGENTDTAAALKIYIANFGLAFQITDDILDAIGDIDKVGKTLRKDKASGKSTYVSLYGVDGARAHAQRLVDASIAALDGLDARAENLRELARYLMVRES